MDVLVLKAHAKINFFLEVGKRLSSGYHRITTILQSLSLADVITIAPADGIYFTCDDQRLAGEKNLVVAAAGLLSNRFKPNAGARLSLFKKIPVAAGLGGGSADAAAALIGLNRFWDLRLSDKQLAELGPELGADVNFCLAGGTALATGFGEKIKPLPPVDIGPFLLAKPHGGLSSGCVYAEFDLLNAKALRSSKVEAITLEIRSKTLEAGQNWRTRPKAPDARLTRKTPQTGFSAALLALRAGDSAGIARGCVNDLEAAAISLMPEIAVLKERAIKAGAAACVVSGSGSSVFAIPAPGCELGEIAEALDGLAETWVVNCENHGTKIMPDENEIKMVTS